MNITVDFECLVSQ